ncbi:hypothetical protein [Salinadaptatus halalkaliphilus]|uniref:hypothetical protein n=1 Tax=Salinadaptatus halalkaliphilus TaxID=2419781 RepID=UPI0015807979|nr:hypothetical protein [Salinadaptatus halalkaliphilus]
MHPAALPSDPLTIVAVLFLLFGVPAILFALLLLYTGYVRYDAERYLEELEDEALEGDERRRGSVEMDDTTGDIEATEEKPGDKNEYSVFEDRDDEQTDPGEYSVFEDTDDED